MMNRSLWLGVCAAVMSGVAVADDVKAQSEYTWDLPETFAPTSIHGLADQMFADLVAEKTDGRIDVVPHFEGALGYRGVDHLDAVSEGSVPTARLSLSYFGGFDPIFRISTLPFVTQSPAELEALWGVYQAPLEEFLKEEYNQIAVSAGAFPPSGIWTREPLESLEDLKGLKVRTFDVNSTRTFTRAGAAAVDMGFGEVLPALSTGAIDGVVTSADAGHSAGLGEFLPYFHEINWNFPISPITINEDVWSDLPEDLREAVRDAGSETTAWGFERLSGLTQENYAEMREEGITVITDPPEEILDAIQEAGDTVIQSWREDAGDAAKILDEYQQAVSNQPSE